jgi:hypothetical protein
MASEISLSRRREAEEEAGDQSITQVSAESIFGTDASDRSALRMARMLSGEPSTVEQDMLARTQPLSRRMRIMDQSFIDAGRAEGFPLPPLPLSIGESGISSQPKPLATASRSEAQGDRTIYSVYCGSLLPGLSSTRTSAPFDSDGSPGCGTLLSARGRKGEDRYFTMDEGGKRTSKLDECVQCTTLIEREEAQVGRSFRCRNW